MDSWLSLAAGFPSPAELWRESPLALETLLVEHPDETYYLRMRGSAMRYAEISDHDILVVDRLLPARDRSVVIAKLRGVLMAKRIHFCQDGEIWLSTDHPRQPPFRILPEHAFEVWGVVTWVLRSLAHAPASRTVSQTR